jgi:pyruvate dehydrogenase E2 component (dihydrolipoamide acetyltransferase)
MSDVTTTSEQGLKGEVTIEEPDRFARAIARRSAESRATVPTVEYSAVADVSALTHAETANHATLTALIVTAAAAALRQHPRANAAYKDARYEQYGRVNIGVTLAAGDTFVTPTVMDADTKTAAEIADELADHRAVIADGELHPSVLAGATFTVLAPTGHDVLVSSPIVTGGQAAVLTAGPVRAAACVRDGALVAGHTIELVLAADHRILYGALATAFLDEVKTQLEGAAA